MNFIKQTLYRACPASWDEHKCGHFYRNILSGIIVSLGMYFFEHYSGTAEAMNNLIVDPMLRWEAMNATPVRGKVVFIDIEGRSWRDSTADLRRTARGMQREEIARIVSAVDALGAKVLVFDMVLDEPDCCYPQGDVALRAAFAGIASSESDMKVVFPVDVSVVDGHVRPTLFDDITDASPRNLYPSSPVVEGFRNDRTIRYIRPGVPVNRPGGDSVLETMPFTAVQLFHNEVPNVLAGEGDDVQRFRYLLRPPSPEGTDPERSDPGNLSDESGRIRFIADEVDPSNDSVRGAVKDAIVIVGMSDPDNGDIHNTPVGPMPGMYVQGNAINTLLSYGLVDQPSLWILIPLEILFLIAGSYLFLVFHSLIAEVLTIILVLVISGVVMVWMFTTFGVLVNPLFAVAATAIHRIIAQIEEASRQPRVRNSTVAE